jgi:hypothetical protein
MAKAGAGASALVFRALLPPHPGPPLGRGRIARRAVVNPERLDSSQRGMRRSLSLRERVRVRENETQPTKTAGRISPAQPDRLPDSELTTISSARPVDGGSGRGRKRIGVSSVTSPSPRPLPWAGRRADALLLCVTSPSPRPSPWGRGRIARRAVVNPQRLDSSQRGMRRSLSLRERARVRGNQTQPTKTAGRILPAQPDRLPDSELTTTSSARPVDGGSARGRKRIGVSSVASPSPRPLPWGEGESHAAAWRIERAGSCGCLGLESRSARSSGSHVRLKQDAGCPFPLPQ